MPHLTVRSRLLILTGAVAAILAGAGGAGLFGVARSNEALRDMYVGRAKALQNISTIDELITQSHYAISDAVLDPSAQKTQSVLEATRRRVGRVDELLSAYARDLPDDKERKLATRFAADWRTLRDKGFAPTASYLAANNLSEAQWVVTQQIEPTVKAVKSESTELRALQLTAAQQEYDRARELGRKVQWLVCAFILGGIALVGVLCASMARALFRQLGGEPALAAEAVHRVAKGDLQFNVPVAPGDTRSVMYATSVMRARLASVIGDIKSSTETIATATAGINSGNSDLSARTEEHAASIQQTSASMEQLASTVKANADHAQQARTLATSASDKAREGDRAVADAVRRMTGLSARSAQIGEITSVIEGIAFQTNLLALNAAVEAARAGTTGRGFAVVAQEVRALAQRSSQSAREISALLDDVTTEVQSSGKTVKAAGETIVELLGSVTGVAELVDAIATASREQSAGIDQINDAVSQMDRMTQKNAALVQDAAFAAAALEKEAHQLRQSVQVFTV
jgi:methyl-accepting chemotaxis protein-1 (serine sensor receptor)